MAMRYHKTWSEVYSVESRLRNPVLILSAAAVLGVLGAIALVAAYPLYGGILREQWGTSIAVILVIFGALQGLAAACILIERKMASYMQDRIGPNRVGWWGLLQPIADGVKFLLKEDIIPKNVDKPLFVLAPAMALAVAYVTFAIIPWAGNVHWPGMEEGKTVSTQVASLDVGFVYLLSLGSLSVYGVVLAGYASNNKYAFYGGMRATAQMLSYEVPMGLALLTMLFIFGTMRLETIVDHQASTGMWNLFLQPIAALLLLISALAEANRAPFDLAEAEQELVGGYHTEYSAMKFAMFFLGEYTHMLVSAALITTLFLGGWHIWGGPGPQDVSVIAMLTKFGIFWAKVLLIVSFYMAIRWTIPRFRYDQLMRLAWQGMIPVGFVLVLASAVLTAFNIQRNFWPNLIVNLIVAAGALAFVAWMNRPITGRQENLPAVDVLGKRRRGVVREFAPSAAV
jgi:NADH-quinone oxidoreductase subunit H